MTYNVIKNVSNNRIVDNGYLYINQPNNMIMKKTSSCASTVFKYLVIFPLFIIPLHYFESFVFIHSLVSSSMRDLIM